MLKRYCWATYKSFFKKHLIIWLIVSLLLFNLIYLITQIVFNNQSSKSFLMLEDEFSIYVPFIIMSLITITYSLSVFNDSYENGQELLLVTMEKTRLRIFITKLTSGFLIIFSIQIISILSLIIPIVLDNYASFDTKVKYIFSFTFGSIIVQLLVMSVSFSLINILKRTTFILVMIMGIVISPLISMVSVPLLNATPNKISEFNNPKYLISNNNNEIGLTDQHYYSYSSTNLIYDYQDYEKTEKYSNFVYLDSWYYTKNLVNLFANKDKLNNTRIQKWKMSQEKFENNKNTIVAGPSQEKISIMINKDDYHFDRVSKEKHDISEEARRTSVRISDFIRRHGDKINTGTTKNWKENFEQSTLTQRLAFVQWFLRDATRDDVASQNKMTEIFTDPHNTKTKINSLYSIEALTGIAYQRLLSDDVFPNLSDPITITDWYTNNVVMIGNFGINSENIITFDTVEYIPKWLTSLIILFLITIFTTLGWGGYKWKDISVL